MTDLEFDVIDELYFVTSFHDLLKNLSIDEDELVPLLKELIDKGWVKCLRTVSDEFSPNEIALASDFQNYFYLATKAGLLAHNTRG